MSNFSTLFPQEKPKEKIDDVDIQQLYVHIGKLHIQKDFLKKAGPHVNRQAYIEKNNGFCGDGY